MRSFSVISPLILSIVAPLINGAQHHHHLRHRDLPYPTGGQASSGVGPFPSGAITGVPYPAGNGTSKGATGTGTGVITTVTDIVYTTLESTIYQTSPEAAGPQATGVANGSPNEGQDLLAATSGAAAADNGGASASGYVTPGSGASAVPIGLTNEGGSCAVPTTVTMTTDFYVTVTAGGASQTPSASQAPIQSQSVPPSPSPILPQPIIPGHSPLMSETASITPLASAPINPSASSAAAAVGPVSSNDGLPYAPPSSASSSTTEQREDQPGFVPPTMSIATATTPSQTLSAVTETPPASIAASVAPAASSTASIGSKSLIPNGKKAGVAGYRSITDKSSWGQFTAHIGWYSDYWPNTPDSGSVTGVGMVGLSLL